MGLNNSKQLIIEDRRRDVAVLRRKRLTVRQIAQQLAEDGYINADTGGSWSIGTIQRDLDTLQEEAHAAAIQDVSLHKADILDRYEHLWLQAMNESDWSEARHVLKGMRELLGTDAPTVIVFEQVQARMSEAYSRLKEEFGADPETWSRVVRSLMEGSDPAGPGASASHLPN